MLLSTDAWKTILLDAYGRLGIEACGALLGTIDRAGNWCVEVAYPLRNTYASPVYFEFDPLDLLTIDQDHPGRMIGVYHSHPTGPALASATDRRNMKRVNADQHIPWVWLIISGPFHSREPSQPSAESPNISAQGIVAYYHYPDQGLKRIELLHTPKEQI